MTIRHLKDKNIHATTKTDLPKPYLEQLLKVMNENGEHHGIQHSRWQDLTTKAKEIPAFAFVRNPWSRVVSRYTFLINNVLNRGKGRKWDKRQSFEEFLEERHKWKDYPYYWHRAIRNWYNQKDYVIGNVDVLRTEHMYEDFKRYFGYPLEMHKRNISNISNLDYKDFYTPQTKQIIADWYGEDIEYFGFTFEGTATRNVI